MMDVFIIVMVSLLAMIASLAASVAIGMTFHAGTSDEDEDEHESLCK